MEKKSIFNWEDIPEKYRRNIRSFWKSYKSALEADGISFETYAPLLETFFSVVKKQFKEPFQFAPYHQQIRKPFDYYAFGLDLFRPLVDMKKSQVKGLENAEKIERLLKKGDNVILFANHQIEADPQAIGILLEKSHPELASNMIFVAGERVVTDPVAIPISMGCNLLCIYSKRYIDHPPELKIEKQLHNKRTMELMSQLLKEGGKCIYVAPSGGRDRASKKGVVQVAHFDPQSIEMFYLMAKKSGHPTHFYPLALATYKLLPPPDTIQIELGESRLTKRGAIHMAFGSEIDMEKIPGSELKDKHLRRKARADYIWNQVCKDYYHLGD